MGYYDSWDAWQSVGEHQIATGGDRNIRNIQIQTEEQVREEVEAQTEERSSKAVEKIVPLITVEDLEMIRKENEVKIELARENLVKVERESESKMKMAEEAFEKAEQARVARSFTMYSEYAYGTYEESERHFLPGSSGHPNNWHLAPLPKSGEGEARQKSSIMTEDTKGKVGKIEEGSLIPDASPRPGNRPLSLPLPLYIKLDPSMIAMQACHGTSQVSDKGTNDVSTSSSQPYSKQPMPTETITAASDLEAGASTSSTLLEMGSFLPLTGTTGPATAPSESGSATDCGSTTNNTSKLRGLLNKEKKTRHGTSTFRKHPIMRWTLT